jgi:hypothetical protein
MLMAQTMRWYGPNVISIFQPFKADYILSTGNTTVKQSFLNIK